ncbi:hypothetical protein SAMN05421659_103171 [[Clostridium] fimetarium]|uniref:Uncharacterized protein n=2 Tax=[Clostridium] fimetarium TaxID=99656 RepID=A0A1I0NK65_9FIRM|nr:hypothetical protein SAMN05421659_103171 [[Clostridium] fimetarium]
MKIVKRIIAATSIIALIVCTVLGIQEGLFDEMFNQLKNMRNTTSEVNEFTTYNASESQTVTTSDTGQNAIANAPRLATFDKSLFYNFGEDIYFNYLPSMETGEVLVNVKRVSINTELEATNLDYLYDPDVFSRYLNKPSSIYSSGYYMVSVEIQFTNIGITKTSWGVGNCSIHIFDKNGQADTSKGSGIIYNDGKISGDGLFKNGEIHLQAGETALCKWTGMLPKYIIDGAKDKNEQIYFVPSNMYFRYWTSSYGAGRLAFVELNFGG